MRLHLDTGMNGNGVSSAAETAQTAAAGNLKGGTGAQRASVGGDSTHVSGTSTLFSQMAAGRAHHIERLTQLVQAGSYDVQSGKLARSIVEHAAKDAL
jgi:anti-sigma28 factor (negative regulator of flagellin synthesis)